MSLEQLRVISDRRLATGLLTIVLIPALWFGALAARSPLTGDGVVPNVASAIVAIVGLWFVRRAKTRAQLSRAVFGVSIAVVPVLVAIGLQRPQGWFYQPSEALLPLIAMYGALPNDLHR